MHLLYGFCNYLWFYSSSDPHNKEVMAYVMDEVLKHPDNKYESQVVKSQSFSS